MSQVIVVTGASSGFGRLTAEALARAGHTVHASMRNTTGRNAPVVEQMAAWSKENGVELRTVEMGVQSQDSVDAEGENEDVRDLQAPQRGTRQMPGKFH